MDKGILYGILVLIAPLLIGTFMIGLLPAIILSVALCGLVAGYTTTRDVETTTITVMFIVVLTGFLFWPSLLVIIGVMFISCLIGALGVIVGYRFNPSLSVPQPAL